MGVGVAACHQKEQEEESRILGVGYERPKTGASDVVIFNISEGFLFHSFFVFCHLKLAGERCGSSGAQYSPEEEAEKVKKFRNFL